jgi:hypothetical protein
MNNMYMLQYPKKVTMHIIVNSEKLSWKAFDRMCFVFKPSKYSEDNLFEKQKEM